MLTMLAQNTRRSVSAVTAMAIVACAVLTLDQAYVAAAPRGTIDVGELTPVGLSKLTRATLPEIVVTAQRSVQFADALPAGRDSVQS